MTTKPPGNPAGDLADWPGSPVSTLHHADATPALPIRVEECKRGSRYVVRFELPGVDPERDLDVSVDSQVLSVHAERRPAAAGQFHTEFRYGRFWTNVILPAGVDDSDVTALCQDGVLEVSIGYRHDPAAHHVAVVVPEPREP